MTVETHIAGLERRITDMEQLAVKYEREANAVVGTSPAAEWTRTCKRVSMTSCRRDAMQCRAKIAELRALALEAA
jgi:hypothetical protein